MQGPFIYKFETENNHYIYDVNSNAFIRCTKTAFNILPDMYDLNPSELSEKYGYQINNILDTELTINNLATSKSIFSCNHPKKMQFTWDNAEEILHKRIAYLRLETTDQCNQRCNYCYFSGNYVTLRTHGNNIMSTATAFRAVDFLFQHSSDSPKIRISFYGGEPLLNFRTIKETVEYAKYRFRTRVSFDIITNGVLLNDEIMEFLVRNEFWVILSLDGPSEIHDRNRVRIDGSGTFSKVWKNLNDMNLHYPIFFREKVSIRCTMTPPTTIQQMIDFFDSSFLAEQEVSFSTVCKTSSSPNDETRKWLLQITRDSYLNLQKRLQSKQSDAFKYMPRSISDPVKNILNRKPTLLGEVVYPNKQCLPGARWPTVTTEGNIIICDAIGNNKDMLIGDIENGWNMKTITSVIDKYINVSQACLTCWLIRLCPCCLPTSLDEKGDISRSAKEVGCEVLKKEYDLAFREYLKMLESDKKIFEYICTLNRNEVN